MNKTLPELSFSVRWLRWVWSSFPSVPAHIITQLTAFFIPQDSWSNASYFLTYDCLRGRTYSPAKSLIILNSVGLFVFDYKIPNHPPLWWALASNDKVSNGVLNWAQRVCLPIYGRYVNWDFLAAAIHSGNKKGFAWALSRGLPPNGPLIPSITRSCEATTPIESDFRTPLCHVVICYSEVSSEWWKDVLFSFGAKWDFAGEGLYSAKEMSFIIIRQA